MTPQPTLDADLFPEEEQARRYLGRCPISGCKSRPANSTTPHTTEHRCTTHGRAYTWQAIEGRHSARRCDSRCIYAKGPDCECQCSGANHGRGW